MSHLIVPDHLGPRFPKRANDFATLGDVEKMVQQHLIAIFGPTAQLVTEICDRVQVIEDQLGIVAPDKNAAHIPGHCDGCGKGWDFCECAQNQRQQSTSGDIE